MFLHVFSARRIPIGEIDSTVIKLALKRHFFGVHRMRGGFDGVRGGIWTWD